MRNQPTLHVATVTVTDPDTKLPVVMPDGSVHDIDLDNDGSDDGDDAIHGDHDASYREEGSELLLFPNTERGGQWVYRLITTNVAGTIRFTISRGREVVRLMREDGLTVIEQHR